jgi:adenylate kinase
MDRIHRIVFLSPPGAGKGTQADLIQERLGPVVITTGKIFRQEIKDQTELGKLAKSYMDQGDLVPDEVTMKMFDQYLQDPKTKQHGFIIDGVPRTVPHAEILDRMLLELNLPLTAIIVLDVPFDIIESRLTGRRVCSNCGETYHVDSKRPQISDKCDKCGNNLITRVDDQPETVKKRLQVYTEQTEPVINYYQRSGLIKNLEKVYSDIIKAISE